MLTLSYGYKQPQAGDFGSTFFPALEDDIVQLNGHNHNGVNSALITPPSFSLTQQSISSLLWLAVDAGGNFRQLITMPGSITFDTRMIFMRDAASGSYYDLTIEKNSANTYYVYINDSTVNLTAYYV